MAGEEGPPLRRHSTRNGNNNKSSMSDDGLGMLQLSFLQSDELSKFLSPSKEWILDPNEPDSSALDEVDMSPVDFFGHYSLPGGPLFGNDSGFTPQPGTVTPFISQAGTPMEHISNSNRNNNHNLQSHQSPQGLNLSPQIPGMFQAHSSNNQGPTLDLHNNIYGKNVSAEVPFQSFLNTFDSPRNGDVDLVYSLETPTNHPTTGLSLPPPRMSVVSDPSDTRKQPRAHSGKRPSEEVQRLVVSAKYLEFLPCNQRAVIYDTRGNTASVGLTASLMGNFFLSQSNPIDESGPLQPPPSSSASSSPHLQLTKDDLANFDVTFYRRNLFQVIATVSNSHNAAYVGNSENTQLRSRILSLSLAVTVVGNDSPLPKKLLYSPPKTVSEKKTEHEPAIKFFYPKNSGYDEVINWKRLQFRNATAHNGRKKLQNYFSVCVSLYAELENTQRVCLADAYSRPIIVRGRNPRFYQNRDFITIPYDNDISSVMYHAGIDYYEEGQAEERTEDKESPEERQVDQSDDIRRAILRRESGIDPKDGSLSGAMASINTETQSPATKSEVTEDKAAKFMAKGKAVPQRSDPKARIKEPSDSPPHNSNKDDDYEYFPMPLNYWLPPVEVVYRPHAIHHPLKYPRGKSQIAIDNSKRYFSTVE